MSTREVDTPVPAAKSFLEDYEVGEVFVSQARTMTDADVVLYSMFSGDWDRRSDGDGTWLVPEMFTFSVGLCLLLGAGRYTWMARTFIAFYGFDEIDIVRPARVGDTLSSRVTVLELLPLDVEHAKTTPFGQRIAHGNIAFNLCVTLAAQAAPGLYRPEGYAGLAGWRDVRFTAPVFIGDTIRAERTLEECAPGPDPDVGILSYDVRVINQRDETVMVGRERLRVRRRTTGDRTEG
jgi:monoamine oxidase